MAYTALYRKYRPKVFSDVIGQEHIIRTLKNQIASGRVSHSYLFCGTRGTGKTSTAKLFAAAINCESLKDGEPCGKCEACEAFSRNRSVNIIEMDAASNNGVENIREIREDIKYPPAAGRYKIYIIDEVHMLSIGAFNALLKTLEEPPEHVIFILATTDPQKVPVTILSRCQRFDFRRIPASEITAGLKKYCSLEGISCEEAALYAIARLGDGSMRDSLSILDRCVSFYFDEAITEERVRELTGAVDNTVFRELASALFNSDIPALIEIVGRITAQGRDMRQFVIDASGYFRTLLLAKTMKDASSALDMSSESLGELIKTSPDFTNQELMHNIKYFSELSSELRYSPSPRTVLEVGLISLASAEDGDGDISGLARKLISLERRIASGAAVVSHEQPKAAPPVKKPKPPADSDDLKAAADSWPSIASEFGGGLKAALMKAQLKQMDGDELYIVVNSGVFVRLAEDNKEEIAEKLESRHGKSFKLEIIEKARYDEWFNENYDSGGDEYDDSDFDALLASIPDADVYE